jgi:hypothetical protein
LLIAICSSNWHCWLLYVVLTDGNKVRTKIYWKKLKQKSIKPKLDQNIKKNEVRTKSIEINLEQKSIETKLEQKSIEKS